MKGQSEELLNGFSFPWQVLGRAGTWVREMQMMQMGSLGVRRWRSVGGLGDAGAAPEMLTQTTVGLFPLSAQQLLLRRELTFT